MHMSGSDPKQTPWISDQPLSGDTRVLLRSIVQVLGGGNEAAAISRYS
jgi:hypothetical protein